LQGGDPLQIDAAAGPYLCEWFNNPENASGYSDMLTVTSYLCPPGTTARFGDRCSASPLSGATFELTRARSGDRSSGVTGDLGDVVFERLIPGDYTLTSIPPAGTNVAVYVVSCQAGEETFDFTYDDANGMRIRLALPGGVDISCAWYNVPPGRSPVTPGQASGSITVHKFLCQGKAIASYNWETDCPAQATAAGFSLKTADGRPIAVGTIDAQGMLTFAQLANGAYPTQRNDRKLVPCRSRSGRFGRERVGQRWNEHRRVHLQLLCETGRFPPEHGDGRRGANRGCFFRWRLAWGIGARGRGHPGVGARRPESTSARGDHRRAPGNRQRRRRTFGRDDVTPDFDPDCAGVLTRLHYGHSRLPERPFDRRRRKACPSYEIWGDIAGIGRRPPSADGSIVTGTG